MVAWKSEQNEIAWRQAGAASQKGFWDLSTVSDEYLDMGTGRGCGKGREVNIILGWKPQ